MIVDEAHRLNEKSGLRQLGENQIKEIIDAARCSVFFLDEDQRIHINDIGSEDEIRRWAEAAGAEVTDLDLPSQFRCNGEDGYLAFVDNFLGIRPTAHTSLEDMDYEFQVSTTLWNSTRGFGPETRRLAKPGSSRATVGIGSAKRIPPPWTLISPDSSGNGTSRTTATFGSSSRRASTKSDASTRAKALNATTSASSSAPTCDAISNPGLVTTHPEARSRHDRSVFGWKKRLAADPDGHPHLARLPHQKHLPHPHDSGHEGVCSVFCGLT